MTNLKRGYGLDENGYIVSEVHLDNINPIFLPCIGESIESLRNSFGLQLHSVYVYGSVARGDAVVMKSDLDLIAMFYSPLSSELSAKLKELEKELSVQYRPLVRDVGIAVADYNYTLDPANYYENAFLKELSVCVHGKDLGARFGPYKLTSEIAIRFNGDISAALNRILTRLQIASVEEVKKLTQNFARKLIRTYYSMVMLRSQIWTTKLYEQAEVFLYFFPEKGPTVQTLLEWSEEMPPDREKAYDLLRREGEWASLNFAHEVERLI